MSKISTRVLWPPLRRTIVGPETTEFEGGLSSLSCELTSRLMAKMFSTLERLPLPVAYDTIVVRLLSGSFRPSLACRARKSSTVSMCPPQLQLPKQSVHLCQLRLVRTPLPRAGPRGVLPLLQLRRRASFDRGRCRDYFRRALGPSGGPATPPFPPLRISSLRNKIEV